MTKVAKKREEEAQSSAETSRVNVTIPKEVDSLFKWFLDYDPRFKGQPAAQVAAHFLALGLKLAYEQGLAEWPGYDADEFTQLVQHQRAALGDRLRQVSED